MPIWQQIADAVVRAAADGRLATEAPLPSVRALAERLVINPNTVAKAYAELVRDGVVVAQPGRGMFVAVRRQVYSEAERQRRLDEALDNLAATAARLGMSSQDVLIAVRRKLGPGA